MKLKKLLLILMSVVMVLTVTTVAFVMGTSAEENSCTILTPNGTVITAEDVATGELTTTFTDLGAAVKYIQDNIQKNGYTVKITTANISIAPVGTQVTYNFTVDGEYAAGQRATVSDTTNSYWWTYKAGGTVKNVILNSCRTFGYQGNTSTLTLENVKQTSKGGLLVNISGTDNQTLTLNLNDCDLYKADAIGDPIIGMFGSSDVTINVNGSTIIQNGGSAGDNWNRSIFNYRQSDAIGVFTLNVGPSLKDANKNSVLYYNPTAGTVANGISSMVTLSAGNSGYATMNLANGTKLYFGPDATVDTTKTDFTYGTTVEYEFNYVRRGTVVDNGAEWYFSSNFVDSGMKTYMPKGTYTYESADVEYNFYQSSSTLVRVFTANNVPLRTLVRVAGDAKYAAKIDETNYYTIADAIAAATEGQTITLVANVLEELGDKKPANNVTIDGDGKAYLNLAVNKYIFNVSNTNLTIKNITIFSGRLAKSVMTDDTTDDATVGTHHLTLNNVTATINKDAMVNMSGDYYGEHVLNIVNCNLTQTAPGQPMLVTYPNNHDTIVDERDVIVNITGSTLTAKNNVPVIWAHAYGEFDGNAEVTVNVGTSTLAQLGGAVNSLAMSSIIRADAVGCAVMNVNLNAGAKLVLDPIAATSGTDRAMISSEAAETNVTLADDATLVFGSETEKSYGTITNMYFIYNRGDFGVYWNDYTDNGAEWIVNEYAPKVVMPNVSSYIAITSNTGAIAKPSAIGTAGTYTRANLVELGLNNGVGASIKLPADNSEKASIRFVAEVDADFKALLGASATYTSRVTKTSYLETANGDFKALDAEYYVDAPAAKWLDDTTFGVALMNIPDYNIDYAVTTYVTITYTDGSTATFWADFDDAANARSVAEVAQKALDSGLFEQYTDGLNAVIEAASGNS